MCTHATEIAFIAGGGAAFLLNIIEITFMFRLKRWKPFEKLLFSLSIADMIVATTAIVFSILKIAEVFADNEKHQFVFFLMSTVDFTLTHIFAITVDRFLAIKMPLRHKQKMQGKLPKLLISFLWTFNILNVVIFTVMMIQAYYTVLMFAKLYTLVMIVLGVFNAMMYIYMFRIVLLRRAKRESDSGKRFEICQISDVLFKRKCKRERHMLVTSIIVVLSNIICTYPICIEIQTVDNMKSVSSVTQLFLLASTICDPLVYFYKGLRERYMEKCKMKILQINPLVTRTAESIDGKQ